MVTPFQTGIPATNSAVQSEPIRDNLAALYDKLQTLEVQAINPASTSVMVLAGPAYFRAGTSNQLKLINFNTTIFDFTTAFGYKTQRDAYGNLYRAQQLSAGPSAFQTQGLYLQVLLSLQPSGQLTFIESLAGQNNALSSPFNICFDDSEIPLALIILQKTTAGVLQPIAQTNISEARPFVSTAFQNNTQVASLDSQVQDNTNRIIALEPALYTTTSLMTTLPLPDKLAADLTTTTNKLVEVFSGTARAGSAAVPQLKFAGGRVNFSTGSGPSDSFGNYNGGTTAFTANYWKKALIGLQYNIASTDPTQNATLVFVHSSAAGSPSQIVSPTLPVNTVPLSYVLYQMNAAGTDIVPLTSTQAVDGYVATRLTYEFPITNLQAVPTNANTYSTLIADLTGTGFSASYVTSTVFPTNSAIEIFDSNTRPIRRFVGAVSFNATTNLVTIQVTNSFTGITLLRSPQVRSVSNNLQLIEDLRPFIGIN